MADKVDDWHVEITHPDTSTVIRPTIVGRPTRNPKVNALPSISIPVKRDEKWQDSTLEDAAMAVWFQGEQQPIDQLESITVTEGETILGGRGGLELLTRVQAEYTQQEIHTAAESLIDDNTTYTSNVDTPNATTTADKTIDNTVTTNAEFSTRANIRKTDPAKIRNDNIELLQSCFTIEGEDYDDSNLVSAGTGTEYSGNATVILNDTGEWAEWDFDPEYIIPAEHVAVQYRADATGGSHPAFEVLLNNKLLGRVSEDALSDGPAWRDLIGRYDEDLLNETNTLRIEATAEDSPDQNLHIDVVAIYDNRYNYFFDNSTDSNNALDGPELYPDAHPVVFNEIQTIDSVSGGDLSGTFSDTSNKFRLALSNDQGETYLPQFWAESFEDGDVSDWTYTQDISVVTTQAQDGTYSVYANSINDGSPQGYYTLSSSGTEIESIVFYYRETNTSNGSGVRLYNDDGNPEVSFNTNNPQWDVDDNDGITEIYAGDGVDRWVKVVAAFDWTDGTYEVRYVDQQTLNSAYRSGDLKVGNEVARVVLESYSGGTYRSGSNSIDSWWDNFQVEGGSTGNSISVNFDVLGPSLKPKIVLSRHGTQTSTPTTGTTGQKINNYTVDADIDTTPLVTNQTFDGRLITVLNDLANLGDFVWSFERDGATESVEWTLPGQRTSGLSPTISTYSVSKTTAETVEEVVVYGSSQRIPANYFDADLGNPVSLVKSRLHPGKEVIQDPDTGTVFERGKDYTMDYQDGKITALVAGDMVDTDRYVAEYQYQTFGIYDDGTSTPDTRVIDIPELTTDNSCEQAAKRIVEGVGATDGAKDPLWEATVSIPNDIIGWSVVDEIAIPDLPTQDKNLHIRQVENSPSETTLTLGSRETISEIVDDIRTRVSTVSRKV